MLRRKASGVPQKMFSTQTHPVSIFVIFLARKSPVVGRTVGPLMVFYDWLSLPLKVTFPTALTHAASPGMEDSQLTSCNLSSPFSFSSASPLQFSRNNKLSKARSCSLLLLRPNWHPLFAAGCLTKSVLFVHVVATTHLKGENFLSFLPILYSAG